MKKNKEFAQPVSRDKNGTTIYQFVETVMYILNRHEATILPLLWMRLTKEDAGHIKFKKGKKYHRFTQFFFFAKG